LLKFIDLDGSPHIAFRKLSLGMVAKNIENIKIDMERRNDVEKTAMFRMRELKNSLFLILRQNIHNRMESKITGILWANQVIFSL